MNKKLIIIITVIFVVVNIATYLFATGKVRIIEKFIYKDKEGNKSSANLKEDIKSLEDEKTATSLGAVNAGKPLIDFNDTDYLAKKTENPSALSTETLKKDNKMDAASNPDRKTQDTTTGGHTEETANTNLASIPSGSSSTTNTTAQLESDESIPMPQLPLFDNDFENDTDPAIDSNIQLPQLPDIN